MSAKRAIMVRMDAEETPAQPAKVQLVCAEPLDTTSSDRSGAADPGEQMLEWVDALEGLAMTTSEDPAERLARRQDLLTRLQAADARLVDETTRGQVATRLRAIVDKDRRVIAEAQSMLHSQRESRGERNAARAAVRGYRAAGAVTMVGFEREA